MRLFHSALSLSQSAPVERQQFVMVMCARIFMSNQEVNELILRNFPEGQDVEITITQRHDTGWGE